MENNRAYNKTIFILVEDEKLMEIKDAVRSALGDMNKPGVGLMFSVDMDNVTGI